MTTAVPRATYPTPGLEDFRYLIILIDALAGKQSVAETLTDSESYVLVESVRIPLADLQQWLADVQKRIHPTYVNAVIANGPNRLVVAETSAVASVIRQHFGQACVAFIAVACDEVLLERPTACSAVVLAGPASAIDVALAVFLTLVALMAPRPIVAVDAEDFLRALEQTQVQVSSVSWSNLDKTVSGGTRERMVCALLRRALRLSHVRAAARFLRYGSVLTADDLLLIAPASGLLPLSHASAGLAITFRHS